MSENTAEQHGNFDKCPHCGAVVTGLHEHYDGIDATAGRTELEVVNEMDCPHCGKSIALVAEMTHSLARWSDVT